MILVWVALLASIVGLISLAGWSWSLYKQRELERRNKALSEANQRLRLLVQRMDKQGASILLHPSNYRTRA